MNPVEYPNPSETRAIPPSDLSPEQFIPLLSSPPNSNPAVEKVGSWFSLLQGHHLPQVILIPENRFQERNPKYASLSQQGCTGFA